MREFLSHSAVILGSGLIFVIFSEFLFVNETCSDTSFTPHRFPHPYCKNRLNWSSVFVICMLVLIPAYLFNVQNKNGIILTAAIYGWIVEGLTISLPLHGNALLYRLDINVMASCDRHHSGMVGKSHDGFYKKQLPFHHCTCHRHRIILGNMGNMEQWKQYRAIEPSWFFLNIQSGNNPLDRRKHNAG